MALTKLKQTATDIFATDGSRAMTGAFNLNTHKATNMSPGTVGTDGVNLNQLNAAIAGLVTGTIDVATLSTANIAALTGLPTVDGVTMTAGQKVLLTGQTSGVQNGPWVVAVGAWTRPVNYANGNEFSGTFAFVQFGTVHAGQGWITVGTPDIIGTDPSTWSQFSTPIAAHPTTSNKNMTGAVTVSDGDLATATAVVLNNSFGGYVEVQVNGIAALIGNGTKVAVDCYFSGDGGTTPRTFAAIVTGDLLYWNGTQAGYQLAASDRLNFLYNVVS